MVGGILFGVIVYAGMIAWLSADEVVAAVRRIPIWVLPAAMGLSLLNYLIRFLKWERYRKLLGIDLERKTSFLIYLAGLSMSITPGKMGEVFKSWLIRKVNGTPIHRSAPIVVAERFTDLLGYLILMSIGGMTAYPEKQLYFWATLAVCLLALALAGSHRVAHTTVRIVAKLPRIGPLAHKVEGAFESTRILLAPRQVILPTLQSVVSWGCECTGFWLIANAMIPEAVPFQFAVFAFAFSAIAGAVLIIFPGGLGPTELSLGSLLRGKFQSLGGLSVDAARAKAGAAVILTRVATLWFAVFVGLIATYLFRRHYGRELDGETEPSLTS
jgi:uncharacterized protein (TIRG00374 family)